jgi:hypothetical protein
MRRYNYYREVDTSRGRKQYWETSAMKIGLVDNSDRDGIIFRIEH